LERLGREGENPQRVVVANDYDDRLYLPIPTQYIIFEFSELFSFTFIISSCFVFRTRLYHLVFSSVVRRMPDYNLNMGQGPHTSTPTPPIKVPSSQSGPPTHRPIAVSLSSRDRTTWVQASGTHPT
jgi:hypothetical protein